METFENIPDKIIESFSQGINSEEKKELCNWVNQDVENNKVYWEFKDVWQATSLVDNKYDENLAWEKFAPGLKISKPAKKLNFLKYAAIAIIFSALGSLTFYLLQPSSKPTSVPLSFHEVYVPYGSTSKIILPDGSYVWLNAGSYLRYNNSFNINNRDIFIKGEAYFDVQKNNKLAFLVQTPGIQIKAVGTKFNVKAYPEEKTITATVVEGKIEVTNQLENPKKQNELFLTEKQSASFVKEFTATPVIEPEKNQNSTIKNEKLEKIPVEVDQIKSEVNPEFFISWREGKLLIEREKLSSLAIKLERKYNVKIKFEDETVKNYVFSGILKDETFEQVIDVIKFTSPLQFTVQGNVVKLSEDKSMKNKLK